MFTRFIHFTNCYQIIAIDLSKQQKVDVDPKVMQQISFTGSINRAEGERMLLTFEDVKEPILYISKGTVRRLWFNLFQNNSNMIQNDST